MEKNYAIDYIKFYAILSIVAIHTTPFRGINVLGVDGDNINFVIDTFARFGVPFFFMTSGFLFSSKILQSNNHEQYLKKYLLRISKLYVSWYFFFDL